MMAASSRVTLTGFLRRPTPGMTSKSKSPDGHHVQNSECGPGPFLGGIAPTKVVSSIIRKRIRVPALRCGFAELPGAGQCFAVAV